MDDPSLGILMPSSLEFKVGVLTGVKRNFGESLGFRVSQIFLVHQIPKHSHAFSQADANFNQGNTVGITSINLEVVGYKLLLDHLNFFP